MRGAIGAARDGAAVHSLLKANRAYLAVGSLHFYDYVQAGWLGAGVRAGQPGSDDGGIAVGGGDQNVRRLEYCRDLTNV
jgi:hypothetical protein